MLKSAYVEPLVFIDLNVQQVNSGVFLWEFKPKGAIPKLRIKEGYIHEGYLEEPIEGTLSRYIELYEKKKVG